MPRHIRLSTSSRQGGRRPELPRLFIPDVKGFPGNIRHRSFDQGVKRNSWLLSTQVYELPDSEMTVPIFEFAMTLTHGAGLWCEGEGQ